jgi:hypothetical protein
MAVVLGSITHTGAAAHMTGRWLWAVMHQVQSWLYVCPPYQPLQGSLSADKLESALLDPRSNLPLVGDLVYRLAHRCELYNTTYQARWWTLLSEVFMTVPFSLTVSTSSTWYFFKT